MLSCARRGASQLAGARGRARRRGPLKVPVWIGDDRREGSTSSPPTPGSPIAWWPRRPRRGPAMSTRRSVPRGRGRHRRPTRRGAAARRPCCAPAPGGRGAGGARVREAVARGRRRRVRGDRLPGVLRARGDRPRAGRSAAAAAGRAQRAALGSARHRRGDLAVELPHCDRLRKAAAGLVTGNAASSSPPSSRPAAPACSGAHCSVGSPRRLGPGRARARSVRRCAHPPCT